MTPYLIEALVACCILLSLGMVLIFAFTICLLLKLHKIMKLVSRISSLFNFEARWLAPLLIGKKFILNWLRKKYADRKMSQLADELEDNEDSENSCSSRLLCGAKLAAIALCAWLLIRKKD
ncbi:hypothetical protein FTN76_01140 [Chlamydia trachomatis]|uniref:Uncharacterized protein n=5 Tax=Chlamydia trachomatis TaxID=813 RepID=O84821_CHLTR|nr:hypothetical protein [Chlamydia trachomatis]NP_220335.1 hypothetical protein CT_814.1 [Chlamydia trachomatis D/UW-3/CX]AAC68411.1 hypothetical protein CT_814.1 [Chlamydia trachomatis D/UW-3/CX]AAX51096.1 hypothetical membrane associated protein [Chlamydia trachomatis A/HAR-13]ADH17622.1 hypothetical protein E150_04365 [Chlamydia trachomatis E/150]ADH18542.1 hypothetical protein G9768_04325 [Chlamydia trachomatis G/9768]ADH19469.1 hypothetical protein G11222_04355 [Chlamydia trachomatis G/1